MNWERALINIELDITLPGQINTETHACERLNLTAFALMGVELGNTHTHIPTHTYTHTQKHAGCHTISLLTILMGSTGPMLFTYTAVSITVGCTEMHQLDTNYLQILGVTCSANTKWEHAKKKRSLNHTCIINFNTYYNIVTLII